jgi:ADP-ribosylglycohydrolase/protein-tyrosine phosphatase
LHPEPRKLVEFIPYPEIGLRGRLGIAAAPGVRDGRAAADPELLLEDLRELRDVQRVHVLVSLLGLHESQTLGIVALSDQSRALDMELLEYAVEEGGAPLAPQDLERSIVRVLDSLDQGLNVVVHGRRGRGRAGMFAACVLVARAHDPASALRIVREVRGGAVDTDAQLRFVVRFHEHWQHSATATRLRVTAESRCRLRPRLDKFTGCLLGGALGDALGHAVKNPVTRSSMESARQTWPGAVPEAELQPRRTSDRTELALFACEGLVRGLQACRERPGSSLELSVARAWGRWLALHGEVVEVNKGVGFANEPALREGRERDPVTVDALESFLRCGRPATLHDPPNDERTPGALVAAAPAALASRDVTGAFDLGRALAAMTHGNPSGYLAAAAAAALVFQLLRDTPPDAALEVVLQRLRRERYAEPVMLALERARVALQRSTPDRRELEVFAPGAHAEEVLGLAAACAFNVGSANPGAALGALVRATSFTRSTEAVATLTGQLIGAHHGTHGWPGAWLDAVDRASLVRRAAVDLHAVAIADMELDFVAFPPE